MSATRIVFVTTAPIGSGAWKVTSLPAHIRRGKATGGRKPPRLGWPSVSISACGTIGTNHSHCASGGASPPSSAVTGWSSRARSPRTGQPSSRSVCTSSLPFQAS